MEQKELQKLLNQPYNQENWKKIVLDIFPNVSILSAPKVFPINNPKIEKFSQLGNVRLQDGKNLALFELILNDSVNLSKNRVELNNEISKYIDQEQIHGVLSVFEQGNDDYRFTFSARSTEFDEQEGDFVSNKTDTKRFTYVLGKNESCRTAAERFHQLSEKKDEATIKAIQNAFSVEQVSKEFFDKYTKQFDKFWKYIKNTPELAKLFPHTDDKKQEIKIRDFTKKLLGRIVFLHFLQKKEWMGCKAGTNEWIAGDKRFMQNLYESFSDKEHFYSQSLSKLFFEVLNKRRVGDIFNIAGLKSNLNDTKVPYLNGGLFDTDEDISKKIDFPQEYFENLFNFFGEYNFTIDENDPNDHEVGIDPEMLGHIFENLLEDNKDKAAFYTPKDIVQYMCQESIIEYLKTSLKLTVTQKDKQEAITELIRDNLAEHVSDYDIVAPIAEALYDVKVCDPAIGSGAFPMGILNTIYQAVENLYYLQPDSVAPIWKISETVWQPHLVKKNIIQHSIYGVDIESGAVDIARLRFWLALVVDETEPLPLPNLDYKIMQGNSLLENFEGIDLSQISNADAYEAEYESEQLDIFTGEAKKKVQISIHFEDIEALMEQYFNANNAVEKKEIHKKIDEQVTNHIRFTLLEHRKEIEEKTKKLQKDLKYKEAAASNWQQKEKIRTESKEAKELVKLNKELSLYTNKEIALSKLSTSNERPFFLWHLFFKDVYDDGGFDIVIGNPPYGISIKGDYRKIILAELGAVPDFEIYYYFIELSKKLLKANGKLAYIIPNTYLFNTYALQYRQGILKTWEIVEILDCTKFNIFTTATVRNTINIWSFNHGETIGYRNTKNINSFKNLTRQPRTILNKKELIIMNQNWALAFFLEPEVVKLVTKIKNENVELVTLFKKLSQGLIAYDAYTGQDEKIIKTRAFHYDKKLKEGLKKWILGRDVIRYNVTWNGEKYIDYCDGIANPRNPIFFSEKRILIREITNPSIYASYTENELYNDPSILIILDNENQDIKYILAILNSKLATFFHFNYSPKATKGAFPKILVKDLKEFPIPSIFNKCQTVKKLVDIILVKNEKKENCFFEEQQIDNLIYKLYELSYDEVLIIEPEFSDRMSIIEYEAITLD